MSAKKLDDPDHSLVERAGKGDKPAFGQLVTRHYEMVYAVSFGVLHNREAAKDVTQDVFLKLFRDLSKFKGESKFKTWLYRVTMNAAIDATRKRKPQESLDPTDAAEDREKMPVIITDKAQGPRDSAAHKEIREVVREAVEELSPEHRAILVLREWEELSYEEIADALGIELGTVMSRLHYARRKLGEKIQQMGYGEHVKDFL